MRVSISLVAYKHAVTRLRFKKTRRAHFLLVNLQYLTYVTLVTCNRNDPWLGSKESTIYTVSATLSLVVIPRYLLACRNQSKALITLHDPNRKSRAAHNRVLLHMGVRNLILQAVEDRVGSIVYGVPISASYMLYSVLLLACSTGPLVSERENIIIQYPRVTTPWLAAYFVLNA